MRRSNPRHRQRPWRVLVVASIVLAPAFAPAKDTAPAAAGRTAGDITVSIDAVAGYLPGRIASYWIHDDPLVQVRVVLDAPAPVGGVAIPYVANTVSSTLLFAGGASGRTFTMDYSEQGGQPFYPGWLLDFAYVSLLTMQPPGIVRGTPHTLYPVRVRQASPVEPAGIPCGIDWLCALGAFLGWHFMSECYPSSSGGAPIANSGAPLFVPTLQRYRNEILSATPTGLYYIGVYDTHSPDIILAMAASRTLAPRIFLKRTAWLEGLDALVNGQGAQFVVSQEMQDDLLELLGDFEAAGSPGLAGMIAFERGRLQLDTIAGSTMSEFQDQIETLGGPTAVENRSWGDVKRLYRHDD
jgi:hypothetical protein